MSIPTRGTKSSGGTDFATGKGLIRSSEVDFDLNTLYTLLDGGLSADNWSSGAGDELDPETVDDYSATAAESRTQSNPGTSASPTQAGDLTDELEQLRYVIKRIATGIASTRMDGTATDDDAGWQDEPRFGPNLLKNSSFEAYSGAVNSAPDYWALVGTPTTVALEDTPVGEGEGKNLNVVCVAASENGVSFTLDGVRASSKYLVGCRVSTTTGTFHLKTTGGSGAGYTDLDLTHDSSTWTTVSGIVGTDATPTDLVVQLVGTNDATADDFNVDECFVYEMGDNPLSLPSYLPVFVTSDNAAAGHYTQAGGTIPALDTAGSADLQAAVTVPGPGYYIKVTAGINIEESSGTDSSILVQVEENGADVGVPIGIHYTSGTSPDAGATVAYLNASPTPGTTYTYKVTGNSNNGDVDADGAYILVEMIHGGG